MLFIPNMEERLNLLWTYLLQFFLYNENNNPDIS